MNFRYNLHRVHYFDYYRNSGYRNNVIQLESLQKDLLFKFSDFMDIPNYQENFQNSRKLFCLFLNYLIIKLPYYAQILLYIFIK